MDRLHAFGDDALQSDDALGLVARLRAGQVSPAELVHAAIARTWRVNAAVNGLARRDFERARELASKPVTGFFAGVPTLIKDESDEQGMPNQHGCDAFVSSVKNRDAPIVAIMKRVGLISIGRTTMSEFGFSPSAEHPRLGAVRTPWNTNHISGASSAGSAALVAAGVVPIAKASDGGGSIRIPAAVNGLVGLKTSRGRVPLDGVLNYLPVPVVHEGVLTRSVRDTAAFLREVEKLHAVKGVRPIGDVTGPGTRRLRVALLTTSPSATVSAEAVTLTKQTGELLAGLGHRVEEVRPPIGASFADDFVLYWGQLAWTQLATGKALGAGWDPEKTEPFTRGLAAHFKKNVGKFPAAVVRLRLTGRAMARFHRRYDVLLTPTLGHETPQVGHLSPMQPYDQLMERLRQWVVYTPVNNVTGMPSMSLPLATSSNGLPFGMMFSAAYGQDAMLLALAYELEQARPFARIQAFDLQPGSAV
jgi:amidase